MDVKAKHYFLNQTYFIDVVFINISIKTIIASL